ncbi:DUF58 domain-containing protein [Fusobacterium sp.]|uniref:DUF58 domain-containing protein n=1 Tax=Fusobacterium sp. TaxID=68766 RepID=UPI00396CA932
MNKKEILKKIKKIELASTLLANEIFSGNYRSYFKGNGMEFSDIRRYSPGDDVKKIDWKVTARQRKTYIKQFTEEREMSVYILIDVSKSNDFIAKSDLITQIVGTLAFSAIKNNDKVGAIFFTDRIEKIIPVKKGKKQGLIILDNLLSIEPEGKGTDISKVLYTFNKISKQRSIVFLISDFIDKNYEKSINLTKLRHDIIPIRIADRKFETLPKGAIFTLEDSETNETVIIENFDKDYNIEEFPKTILSIYTDENYVVKLANYFKRRRRL